MAGVGYAGLFGTSNLQAPASGETHALRLVASLNNQTVQFSTDQYAQYVGDFVAQAMMVDNSAGASAVTVGETTSGWSRVINAGETRTFQFPAVEHPSFTIGTSGNVTTLLFLYDWPALPDASINNGNAAAGSVVTIAGQPIAVTISATVTTAPAAVTYVAPAAHTIAVGGTSQVLFAGGAIKTLGLVKNPNAATEPLYVDPINAAGVTDGASGTTVELQAGDTYTFGPATAAINVNAATGGHAYIAWSY